MITSFKDLVHRIVTIFGGIFVLIVLFVSYYYISSERSKKYIGSDSGERTIEMIDSVNIGEYAFVTYEVTIFRGFSKEKYQITKQIKR